MSLRARLVMLLMVAVASPAPAQVQVVVPNVYTNDEGPASTPVPIHVQNNPWTFQLILNQNQLSGLVGTNLTGIRYRHSAVEGGGYPLQTTTWSNYQVRIGPSVAPNAATGTFANNFTSTPTQVRSGPFTVPPNAWPNNGPGNPNAWGPELTFDTPYHYTGGNLALLIVHPGSDNPAVGNALLDAAGMSTPGQGTNFRFIAAPGLDVSTGTASNFLPVIQFSAVTPVPEPSTWLFTGAVVLAVGVARRKRHRLS